MNMGNHKDFSLIFDLYAQKWHIEKIQSGFGEIVVLATTSSAV